MLFFGVNGQCPGFCAYLVGDWNKFSVFLHQLIDIKVLTAYLFIFIDLVRTESMAIKDQQKAWLQAAKRHVSHSNGRLTWDELAQLAGISSRAMKSYRMPESSADYRPMPDLAIKAIESLMDGSSADSVSGANGKRAEVGSAVLAALSALVVRQARQSVIDGRIVSGVSRRYGMQVGLTPEDRRAMGLVSRVALEAGLPDYGAEIHELLFQCTRPLGEWLIIPEVSAQGMGDAPLICGASYMPTPECIDLADGFCGLSANFEERLFQKFIESLSVLTKASANTYYSSIREFIVRNPVCTLTLLRQEMESLPSQLWRLMQYEFYEDVPGGWEIDGVVPMCGHCGDAMMQSAAGLVCRTQACTVSFPSKQGGSQPVESIQRVKRGIKQYWVEPGYDEILLFDRLSELGLESELYPNMDRVDIAVGEIGLDLKAYNSPETLGRRFQKGIGGLAFYSDKWVVIPDWLISSKPAYIDRLSAIADRPEVDFMSVSDALARLKRNISGA